MSNVEVNFYKGYLEAGISLSPSLWEHFATAMYKWKMYRLSAVHKTHKKRGFIARKMHQMKKIMKRSRKFMHNTYKYMVEEFDNEFYQN